MSYSNPALGFSSFPKFTSPDFKVDISSTPTLTLPYSSPHLTHNSLNPTINNNRPHAYTPPCSNGPMISAHPNPNPYSGFQQPRFVNTLPPFDPNKHLNPEEQMLFELAKSKRREAHHSIIGNEIHFHEPSNLDFLNAHRPSRKIAINTIPVPKNILNYPPVDQSHSQKSHTAQNEPQARAINQSSVDIPSRQTTSRMTQMVDALMRSAIGQGPGSMAAAHAAMIQDYINDSANQLPPQLAHDLLEKFGHHIQVTEQHAIIQRKCLGHRIVDDVKVEDKHKRKRARQEADKTHAKYDHDRNYTHVVTSTKGLEKKGDKFYYSVDAYHQDGHAECDKYEMKVLYQEKGENLQSLLHQFDNDLLAQGLNPAEEWDKIGGFKFKSTIPSSLDPALSHMLLEDPSAFQALQKVSQTLEEYCKPIIDSGSYSEYPTFGETLKQLAFGAKQLTPREAEHFLEQVCQSAQTTDYVYKDVKTCLGHADYYGYCSDLKGIKDKSKNALKDYKKKKELQNYSTEAYEIFEGHAADKYRMYVHYQHVDNHEPCRKYFMQEVAEAVTHSAISDLEVLKQKISAQPKVNVADELKKIVQTALGLPQDIKKLGHNVLQKVVQKCNQVSQVLDQHSMYVNGQSSNLIGTYTMHPAIEMPSFLRTIGQAKPIYQKVKTASINALQSPQCLGMLQAFGGIAEIGAGVATTYGTGGFAAPIGMTLCAHGADHFYTGMKTFIGDKHHHTATSQLLRSTGMSCETAGYIDMGLGMVNVGLATAFSNQIVTFNKFNQVILNSPIKGGAYNYVGFEKYKTILRTRMEKPYVIDPTLQRLVDFNYRPEAGIGSGSTAAAIRHESATGKKIFEKLHTQKGRDMITAFEKWLKNNPTASPGDRAAAENIIKDLSNALGE